ncbi:MAG TPA: apolipoprotein N-acyltransferase [Myxococcota bacterium]
MTTSKAAALVALSAALYGLAFAPLPGAWLAAWVAFAPFFAVVASAGPSRAAGLGLLFGLASGLATCWWLPEMLVHYFGMPPLASWLASLGCFAAFAGLHFAAFGAWLAWLARRGRVSPFAVALGFVSCEWARASLLVPNPQALSAYSQIDFRPLAQLADLAGPWGIGFLLAGANALAAAALAPALRPLRWRRDLALLGAALAAALAYGESRLARDFATGPELRVAVVQGGVARSDDARGGDSRAELERYLALTGEAVAASQPQLVVWPEGAIDFSPFGATQRMLRLRDFSRGLDPDLVLGAPRPGADGRRFNAMLQFRRGRPVAIQDKLEPMPFSESRPLGGALGLGRDAYAPGDGVHLFEIGGLRFGTAICSEAMGPAFARRVVGEGATALLNPSNDYWFTSAAPARAQLAKTRFRAIETRRWIVRATSTGYSALIDPRGDLAAVSGFGGAEWLTGSVRGAGGISLHQRIGGVLGPGALAGCLVLSLARFARTTSVSPGWMPRLRMRDSR